MRLILATAALAALAACSGNNAGTKTSTATTTTTSAVTAAPSPAPAGNVVKIGIDLPLSGADASVGISTEQGALLAIEQMQKSMPRGYTLQGEALDDAVQGVHNPEQGAANVRSFISDTAVLAVVGPYNSNVARAEIPVTNAASMAQIGPSVVADNLTLGPQAKQLRRANPLLNTFFRVCTTDSRQGSALAQFARSLGYKRAYIIDDNETYGLDLADRFEKDFAADGGSVLARDHLAKNTQDFKALLLKVAAAKPDVVFFGGVTSTGGGLLRKQMYGAGLGKTAYFGGDGIADLATVAGAQADGSYYTLAAPNAEKLPAAQAFIKAYRARYSADIGPYSANAYAAAQVAADAIIRAIATERRSGPLPSRAGVVARVASTKIDTPIGPISFDKNGDVTNPVLSLYGFKNGQSYFIRQIQLKL
jgi:branched-chain amino acid transport system substrate-binding protein